MNYETTGWYKWFAFYPVFLIDGKLVWLKYVMKKGTVIHGKADGCSEDIWVWQYKEYEHD